MSRKATASDPANDLRQQAEDAAACRAAIIDITERKLLEEERVKERTLALTLSNEHLLQEIQKRVQAEKALKESGKRFHLLTETIEVVSQPGRESSFKVILNDFK
jgi:hypothetical protein